jgi:hypothetical protein
MRCEPPLCHWLSAVGAVAVGSVLLPAHRLFNMYANPTRFVSGGRPSKKALV